MTLDADLVVRRNAFELRCSLTAKRQQPLAVVGRNGSGKTTLLHAIAGLLPLHAGRVVLHGRVLDEPASGTCVPPEHRDLALVFQDHRLFPHLSVRENVAFGPRARGLSRHEAVRRANALLEQLGLGDVAARPPRALSGGQSQRVALGRALATRPAMLLLDEPLSAVDSESRAAMRQLVRDQLLTFTGVCILVTHDEREARALAADVLTLNAGALSEPLVSSGWRGERLWSR
jgi:molybdate transport system ATP-binding protein